MEKDKVSSRIPFVDSGTELGSSLQTLREDVQVAIVMLGTKKYTRANMARYLEAALGIHDIPSK